jgi:hypothetical protein
MEDNIAALNIHFLEIRSAVTEELICVAKFGDHDDYADRVYMIVDQVFYM